MDRLAKLIDAYNHGKIPIERLEQELNFQSWQENAEQYRKLQTALNTIRDNMYNSFDILVTETPEKIILEMERQEEICQFLTVVRAMIGERDYRFLMDRVALNMTHKAIAKKYNLARSTVTTIFNNIPKKIKIHADKCAAYANILGRDNLDNLLPNRSELEASAPEVRGYPFEFLQNVSLPGKWGRFRGRRRFKPKTICLLPEYFEGAFGDKKTVCTLCDKCKRKIE